jgi:hypothetical protein
MSTYKNVELDEALSEGYNFSVIDLLTDVERDVRVEGEGKDKKRVHVLVINGQDFTYDNKHDRNSDYYRFLNAVQRANKMSGHEVPVVQAQVA